jgi:CDP-diacylglycerol--serine O-phosphatidyltransferase
MVSRLPVYSGKKAGTRVPPEAVLPIFVVVVLFFALLLSYPWEVLTIGTLAYLGSLPFGRISYRKHQERDAAHGVAENEAAVAITKASAEPPRSSGRPIASEEPPPTRLN